MPPIIDKEKCAGCAICVDTCPGEALEIVNDIAIVARPDDCVECHMCVDACPTGAITF